MRLPDADRTRKQKPFITRIDRVRGDELARLQQSPTQRPIR